MVCGRAAGERRLQRLMFASAAVRRLTAAGGRLGWFDHRCLP
jgi:hypothetical protein